MPIAHRLHRVLWCFSLILHSCPLHLYIIPGLLDCSSLGFFSPVVDSTVCVNNERLSEHIWRVLLVFELCDPRVKRRTDRYYFEPTSHVLQTQEQVFYNYDLNHRLRSIFSILRASCFSDSHHPVPLYHLISSHNNTHNGANASTSTGSVPLLVPGCLFMGRRGEPATYSTKSI